MQISVRERLKFYLKRKNIRQIDFAKSINISNGYVNAIRQSIQPDKINEISKLYKDLNIEWLLTGEGEMIKLQLLIIL